MDRAIESFSETKSSKRSRVHRVVRVEKPVNFANYQCYRHSSMSDLHWIPMSDEVMFSQIGSDISKINVFTGEKNRVREGCGTRYYNYFSINNNCSKIIAERVTPEEMYSDGWVNIMIRKSEIVLMNFDGTGEEVIELP